MLLPFPSANRDEDAFEDAGRVRHRPPAQSPCRVRPRHPPVRGIQPGSHGAAGGTRGVGGRGRDVSSWRTRTPTTCGGPPVRCGDRGNCPCEYSLRHAPTPNEGGAEMRIEYERDACQGHNRCYLLAPEVFDVDDEGYAVLRVTGDGSTRTRGEGAARGGQLPRVRHHDCGLTAPLWSDRYRGWTGRHHKRRCL